MKIKVKFFTLLKLYLGIGEYEVELDNNSITVNQLLDILEEKIGKKFTFKLREGGKLKKGVIILVNGKNVILVNGKNVFHINGINTIIKDGDVISMFPPGGGG
ncbi:MAG: MoaD/ThiS family protein [Candidatus Hydrothermae bacterium]|nr:MoaD/ThiS family protein [Candidatus Hydrothermae bacterium]